MSNANDLTNSGRGVMHLIPRPFRLTDIEPCRRLPLTDRAAYECEERARLAAFWHHFLQEENAEMVVVEDGGAFDRRLVGFGIQAFVTPAFARMARTVEEPYVARRAMRLWAEGRSPFLSRTAIRDANSGEGLTLLPLHFGFDPALSDLSRIDTLPARLRFREIFADAVRGYQIREILLDAHGEDAVRVHKNLGFRIRNAYGAVRPGLEGLPCLMGLTREEAWRQEGAAILPLFQYVKPRFGLKTGEQEMLRHALTGATDEELAETMGISLVTVRKRWQTIYARVAWAMPALLPDGPRCAAPSSRRRGQEKRRHLLAYLRSHAEELRACKRPRKYPVPEEEAALAE